MLGVWFMLAGLKAGVNAEAAFAKAKRKYLGRGRPVRADMREALAHVALIYRLATGEAPSRRVRDKKEYGPSLNFMKAVIAPLFPEQTVPHRLWRRACADARRRPPKPRRTTQDMH
jgi:hypothetical protein